MVSLSNGLLAASTARSASVVQSRHPGRYPKLKSSTLSYPAFEPLTERHAFATGLLNEAFASPIPSGSDDVVSVLTAQQVSQSLELRTMLILHVQGLELQAELGAAAADRRSE